MRTLLYSRTEALCVLDVLVSETNVCVCGGDDRAACIFRLGIRGSCSLH